MMVKEFDYDTIKYFIKSTSLETGVYVGCDAQAKGPSTRFDTVIVVHYDSKHGSKIFWSTQRIDRWMSVREKLLKEVEIAIDCFMNIESAVGARPASIHLDLNPDPAHKSYSVTKEAIAWVRGMGYNPVIKPDAWAASYAADHYCKAKNN